MRTTSTAKGRMAESYVKRLLERQGYCYVIRSHASLTPIDILASNGTEIVAVQVKQGGYVSQEARQKLVEWAVRFRAKPCVALKQRGRWVTSEVVRSENVNI